MESSPCLLRSSLDGSGYPRHSALFAGRSWSGVMRFGSLTLKMKRLSEPEMIATPVDTEVIVSGGIQTGEWFKTIRQSSPCLPPLRGAATGRNLTPLRSCLSSRQTLTTR